MTTTTTLTSGNKKPVFRPPTDWAFRYEGPINTVTDYTCPLCQAVQAGKCTLRKEQHPAGDCGGPTRCTQAQAATHGYCHNHAGLSLALDRHLSVNDVSDPRQAASFESLKTALLQYVKTFPTSEAPNISVEMKWQQDHQGGPLSRMILTVDAIR